MKKYLALVLPLFAAACANTVDVEDKIEYKVKFNKDTFLLDIKDTNKKYKAGDKLTIISSNYELKKYNNPYEFDYKLYLNSNKQYDKNSIFS